MVAMPDPQRERRILDAAAELLLRHGYRRVTVDDIAQRADVGKGTVYLHWKTREAVFAAVFEREVQGALDSLVQALGADPDGFLLHRLARAYFLTIVERPLLRAFLLADPEVLGRLARHDADREKRHDVLSRQYCQLLVEHGLVHPALTAEAMTESFLATFEGFLRGGAAAEDPLRWADLLEGTIERAFWSGRRPAKKARESLTRQVIELFSSR
jgi:AcrR family transcriptional regulator